MSVYVECVNVGKASHDAAPGAGDSDDARRLKGAPMIMTAT